MALLESIADKARASRDVNAVFFDERASVLVAAAKSLAEAYREGGRLFSMGNGGSSCDAAHIAVEFLHPVTAGRPALAAINLVADIAMISAVGNDIGFDHVFLRQLIAQGRTGDALIGFSTSGNSGNLIAAFAKAKEMRLLTIGFTGGEGGKMKSSGLVDHLLVVAVDVDPPRSGVPCRLLSYPLGYVHTLLADDRGSAGVKEATA